ncbi:MAG: hypothetical protein ACHQ4H_00015 [Ktedonobacterales bacterium]
MPNTFEQQARERLTRSLAFMDKAQALLQDDLLYRSALADAVSAIKNMLQGYLLLRIAATPASGITQQWQEVANTNRMPELLAACADAGLDLRGLAAEVKRLNSERNYRTHEDPARLVGAEHADHALRVAHDVQRRIRDVMQGKPAAHGSAVARAVDGARAVTGQLRLGGPAGAAGTTKTRSPDEAFGNTAAFAARAESSPAAGAPATARPSGKLAAGAAPHAGPAGASLAAVAAASRDAIAALDDADADDSGDTGERSVLPPPRRRGRVRRMLLRSALAAVLLLVGMATGIGIAVPVASGHAPTWLAFATRLVSSPTPVAAATPTSPATSANLNDLTVTDPSCRAGALTLTLTNTTSQTLAYSAGSADPAATLALAPGTPGAAAVFGTLSAGASATLYVAGVVAGTPAHLVITAPGGSTQMLISAC